MTLHHSKNIINLKLYELFISRLLHIFSDHVQLQVIEATESETVDKKGLLYCQKKLPAAKNMFMLHSNMYKFKETLIAY